MKKLCTVSYCVNLIREHGKEKRRIKKLLKRANFKRIKQMRRNKERNMSGSKKGQQLEGMEERVESKDKGKGPKGKQRKSLRFMNSFD